MSATETATAAAKRALKVTAAVADEVRRPAPGVVFLIYHRVGARTPMTVDLPAELFDEQMAWLAERGTAVAIDEALRFVSPQASLGTSSVTQTAGRGDHPVVVTFDDGTADLVELALPILVRHRVPAVFYLATDFVDHARPFPHDGPPLSWAGAREAVSTGLVTIGSHTHTHALLDRIDPADAAIELDRSRALIEEHVGVQADDFAYPKAVAASAAVEPLVRERFRSAALGGCRPNPFGRTDPHRLARSAIQRGDGMRWFARKAAGGMALEDVLRRTVNRRRYADAVT